MTKIYQIEGGYPIAVLVKGKEIISIIEEAKINPAFTDKSPIQATAILQNMYCVEVKDIIIGLPKETAKNSYLGLDFDKNFCFDLVKKSGLYYELFQTPFAKPQQLFDRIAELVREGKKVGFFQGRHRTKNGIDFNRCIIGKRKYNFTKTFEEDVKGSIFFRFIDTYGHKFFPYKLNAYNPIEAIEKLKDKEIDFLVLYNCICSLKTVEEKKVED